MIWVRHMRRTGVVTRKKGQAATGERVMQDT
jgi:hypothetical protein